MNEVRLLGLRAFGELDQFVRMQKLNDEEAVCRDEVGIVQGCWFCISSASLPLNLLRRPIIRWHPTSCLGEPRTPHKPAY